MIDAKSEQCSTRLGFCLLAALVIGASPMSAADEAKKNELPAPHVAGFTVNGDASANDDGKAIGAKQALLGRLVVSELNCVACHTLPPDLSDQTLRAKEPPSLKGVMQRIDAQWLRDFLVAPYRAKPGTTMPGMFDVADAAENKSLPINEQIDAILHYLAGTSLPKPLIELPQRSTASRGKLLYHRIGCVACHGPNPVEHVALIASRDTVPLPDLGAKYSHGSLTDFLLNPLQYRPSGRMPDMKLNLQDASDLAAYLIRKTGDMDNKLAKPITRFIQDAEKAKLGETLFASIGCANCHQLDERRAVPFSKRTPLAQVTMNEGDICGGRPRFTFSKPQVSAIQAWLASTKVDQDLTDEQRAQRSVQLTLRTFNCYACHRRDLIGGPDDETRAYFSGDHDLGDEGKIPPLLTDIGRKLKRDWFRKVLAGQGTLRPYLDTRMPYFGEANLRHLPDAALLADGGRNDDQANLFASGDLEAGRQLMGTEGGLSCITCHGWNDRKSLGIPAPNLSSTTERLQPAWFRQNMLDPASLRPRTLMPSFWPSGQAVNKTILEGDTERQIASLWRFLAEGKQEPSGYPQFKEGEYEIVPTDRVVVQRTFTEVGGTHSVVVGHPQKVHYIFDSATCRVVFAWRGRFIDGYSTWFDRFVAPAKPLGDDQQRFPRADLLTGTSSTGDKSVRYRGYRLDKQGAPSFLYSIGAAQISDQIVPVTEKGVGVGILRTLQVEAKQGETLFTMPSADGMRISLTKPETWRGKTEPQSLPAGKTIIELEYRW